MCPASSQEDGAFPCPQCDHGVMDMPHKLTAAERLRILRKKARLRGERLPDYPDLPEDVAERADEAEAWQRLQAEVMDS